MVVEALLTAWQSRLSAPGGIETVENRAVSEAVRHCQGRSPQTLRTVHHSGMTLIVMVRL